MDPQDCVDPRPDGPESIVIIEEIVVEPASHRLDVEGPPSRSEEIDVSVDSPPDVSELKSAFEPDIDVDEPTIAHPAQTKLGQAGEVLGKATAVPKNLVSYVVARPVRAAAAGLALYWLFKPGVPRPHLPGEALDERLDDRLVLPQDVGAAPPMEAAPVASLIGWLRNRVKAILQAASEGTASVIEEVSGVAEAAKEKASSIAGSASSGVVSTASTAKAKATSMLGSAASGVASAASTAKEKTTSLVESAACGLAGAATGAKDWASRSASYLGSMTRSVAGQAQHQASRSSESLQEMIERNPLSMGVLAAGFGAALGLILPETGRENQLLGPPRDRVVEMARDKVSDIARDKVSEIARAMDVSGPEVEQPPTIFEGEAQQSAVHWESARPMGTEAPTTLHQSVVDMSEQPEAGASVIEGPDFSSRERKEEL